MPTTPKRSGVVDKTLLYYAACSPSRLPPAGAVLMMVVRIEAVVAVSRAGQAFDNKRVSDFPEGIRNDQPVVAVDKRRVHEARHRLPNPTGSPSAPLAGAAPRMVPQGLADRSSQHRPADQPLNEARNGLPANAGALITLGFCWTPHADRASFS
jgi:hypothetical protein